MTNGDNINAIYFGGGEEDFDAPVGYPTEAETMGSSASHYEMETREIMWYGWGFLSAFCFLFILGVHLELCLNLFGNQRQRSRSPFNLYLVFLMIPDLVMSGFCAIACLSNALRGHFHSQASCYFQSWYVIFGFSGSSWMNALIAGEVYRMLESPRNSGTNHPRRYQPPPLSRITRDSLLTLLFAAFVSSWGLWGVSWFPLKTGLNPSGISCFPSTQASAEHVGSALYANLFYYGVFLWVILGAPLLYVSILCYKIAKYNLLPSQGRPRVLALFFFRLGAIFLLLWLPALVMVFILGPYVHSPWMEWVGGIWAHLQGLVSAGFILYKMNVGWSFQRYLSILLWCVCGCPNLVGSEDDEQETDATTGVQKSEMVSGISPSVIAPRFYFSAQEESHVSQASTIHTGNRIHTIMGQVIQPILLSESNHDILVGDFSSTGEDSDHNEEDDDDKTQSTTPLEDPNASDPTNTSEPDLDV